MMSYSVYIVLFYLLLLNNVHKALSSTNKWSSSSGQSRKAIDIYPRISLNEQSEDLNIFNFIVRLGSYSITALGAGGGFYFGHLLGQKIMILISKRMNKHKKKSTGKKSSHINTSVDFDDNVVSVSTQGKNNTTITSLKQDQDEIWRVVNNIFDSSNSRLDSLEQIMKTTKDLSEKTAQSVDELRRNLLDAVTHIDKLESIYKEEVVDKKAQKVALSSYDLLQQKILKDIQFIKNELSNLTNDVIPQILSESATLRSSVADGLNSFSVDPNKDLNEVVTRDSLNSLLEERDREVLDKIKKFGDDIKKMIKQQSRSTTTSKSRKEQ